MTRSVVGKIMWVGRVTVFLVGLSVVLAVVLGVASTALAHSGVDTKLFHLGHPNTATAISKLTASVTGPTLQLTNQSTDAAATALNLSVASGKPPLKVNASAGTATNLSADKLDGKSSTNFYAAGSKVEDSVHADQADVAREAGIANAAGDADLLDGKDSSQFVQGNGITKRGQADMAFGDFPLILSIIGPDVEVRFACFQASPGWNVMNKSGSESVNLFVDRGAADPEHFLLAPFGQTIGLSGDQVGISSTPGGDHLTFQAQSATGTATIEAFSVNSASGCHAQVQALVTR